MGSMDKRITRSLACIIAGARERHGVGLDSLPLRLLDARFHGQDDGV
jgi:hypothetical protein